VFASFEQVNADTDGIGVMLYYGDSKASSEVQLKPMLLSHIITGLEVLQHKGNLLLKVKARLNFGLGVRNVQRVHGRPALPRILVVRRDDHHKALPHGLRFPRKRFALTDLVLICCL
jgi:hypothetical protein